MFSPGTKGPVKPKPDVPVSGRVLLVAIILVSCAVIGILLSPAIGETMSPSPKQGTTGSTEFLDELGNIPVIGGIFPKITLPDPDRENHPEPLVVTGEKFVRQNQYCWVEGSIVNQQNNTYRGIMVYYDLMDDQGKTVRSTYAMIGDLAPAGTKHFETMPVNVSASSAKLRYIVAG